MKRKIYEQIDGSAQDIVTTRRIGSMSRSRDISISEMHRAQKTKKPTTCAVTHKRSAGRSSIVR